mgnify:CR=1 FL=1
MKTGATAGCSGLAGLGGVGVIETLLVVLLTEFDNSEVAFLNSCKPLPTARPISGNLPGPNTTRPMIKIRISSGKPITKHLSHLSKNFILIITATNKISYFNERCSN